MPIMPLNEYKWNGEEYGHILKKNEFHLSH